MFQLLPCRARLWLRPMSLFLALFGISCNKAMKSATEPSPTTTAAIVKRLAVPKIPNQVVRRGGSTTVTIAIQRIRCPDPVVIALENLPTGVGITSKQLTIPPDSSTLAVTFTADTSAQAGEQSIFVYASAPDIERVKQTFTLIVE
jgi:hypothetical protein